MATLFNTKISATYEGLLKTIDNAAITATLKELTDGSGNQSGLYLNTAGDFKVSSVLEWGSLKDTGTGVTITQFVTAANGIENFNNDTTIPTSAAVKLYVDSNGGSSNWTLSGNNIYNSNSGNVGIGTVTPLYKLHTVGSVRIEGTITLGGNVNNFIAGNSNEVIFKTVNLYSFTKGANTVLKINSLGNVGIGTTSPAQKFHLSGGIARFHNVSSNYLDIDGSDAGSNHVIIQNRFNQIQIKTNSGVGAPHISLLPDTGGNVGIGTSSPTEKLYVAGSIGINTGQSIKWGTGATKITGIDGSYISFAPNNSEKVRFLANGNVGIGTTAPTQKTVISSDGNLSLDSSTVTNATLLLSNTDVAYGTYFGSASTGTGLIQQRRNTSLVYYPLSLNPYGGNIGIGTTSPSEKLQVKVNRVVPDTCRIKNQSGSESNYYSYLKEMVFQSNKGSGNIFNYRFGNDSRMVISSAGNVGIGTTSPSAKLHLAESSLGGNPSFIIQDNARSGASALNYILLTDSLNTNQGKIGYLSGLNTDLTLENLVGNTNLISSSQVVITSETNTIFKNFGSEKVRIDSAGNVGIGTTTPLGKLHVVKGTGNTYPTPSTNADVFIIENKNSGNFEGGGMTIFADNGGTANIFFGDEQSNQVAGITCDNMNGKNDLLFTTNGNNERLRIDGNGNVGIGTTSPSAKLEVYATTGITSESPSNAVINIRRNDNTAYSSLLKYFSGNTEKWVAGLSDSGDFTDSSGEEYFIGTSKTTPNLLINSTGNVGIGTNSPSEKLEIAGSSGSTFLKIYDSSANSESGIKLQNDAKTWTIQNWGSGGDNLRILNNVGSTIQLWDENGRVGIGTTSPAFKLDVAGNARIDGDLTVGTTAQNGEINIIDSNGKTFSLNSGNVGNNKFAIEESSTNTRYLVIDGANANVGIGSTSPTEKLEVEGGDIKIKDASAGLILTSPNGTVYKITVANDGTVTSTAV